MSLYPSKFISVSIRKSPEEVYRFASNPENLPLWASGLADANLYKEGKVWVAHSPMGQVKIEFLPLNSFGVLDHLVSLPSGDVLYNPMRVQKNGEGSEVVFTLYRLPQMSEESFEQDATMIKADLENLKKILESVLVA